MVLHGRQSRHVFSRRCTTLALHLLAGLMDLHLMLQSSGCTINWWKPFPRKQCLRFFRNGGITLSSPNWSEHRPRWWWQSNSRGSNVWPRSCSMWSTNTVPNSGQNAIVSFNAGGVCHHPICHRPGRMLPGPRKPASKLGQSGVATGGF